MFQAILWPFLRNRLEKICTGAKQESQLFKKNLQSYFLRVILTKQHFAETYDSLNGTSQ